MSAVPRLATPRPLRAGNPFDLSNVLTLLFVLFAGYVASQHGIWRDEALAFMIARDAHSLSDLFYNLRYEGHPPLWHLMIYVVTRFTVDPAAIQVLHVGLATATVQLVTRYAPFPRIARILFPFGYFTLFEYAVLARNYQLFLLLSVIFCILWSRHRHAYVGLGSILGLLCFSHVLGVILAAAFGVLIIYDAAMIRRTPWRVRTLAPPFILGAGIALISVPLAIQLIIPPADSGVIPGWHMGIGSSQLLNTLTAYWDAYVPIPALEMHFWGVNIMPPIVTGIGGVMLAALLLIAVHPSRRAFWFLLVADVGTATFLNAKIFNGWRHVGPLFVAVIVSLWIVFSERRVITLGRRNLLSVAFTLMLILHTIGLGIACHYLTLYPFSGGREAADFIRPQLTGHELLVARDDFAITAVAAYLPGRSFFYQRGSRWGTFTISRADFSKKSSLDWAQIFSRARRLPVILIYGAPLSHLVPRLTYLGGFDNTIQRDEDYYFYLLAPPPSSPSTRP